MPAYFYVADFMMKNCWHVYCKKYQQNHSGVLLKNEMDRYYHPSLSYSQLRSPE